MKKIIAALVLAAAVVPGFAQMQFGVRDAFVGSAFTGDAGDKKKLGMEEAFGGNAITFEMRYLLSDRMAIHPAVGFELAMATKEIKGLDDFNRAYIDLVVPVLFRFNFTKGFFGELGPEVDFTLADFYWYGNESSEDVDGVNVFNAGLAMGLGYEFEIGLSLDLRYTFGFTDRNEHIDGGLTKCHLGVGFWIK